MGFGFVELEVDLPVRVVAFLRFICTDEAVVDFVHAQADATVDDAAEFGRPIAQCFAHAGVVERIPKTIKGFGDELGRLIFNRRVQGNRDAGQFIGACLFRGTLFELGVYDLSNPLDLLGVVLAVVLAQGVEPLSAGAC